MNDTSLVDDIQDTGFDINELLDDSGADLRRIYLVHAKEIHFEKLESQIFGRGVFPPETDSTQELSVIITELLAAQKGKVHVLRSNPYELHHHRFEEASLELNEMKSHGKIVDYEQKKTYVIASTREDGYLNTIISRDDVARIVKEHNAEVHSSEFIHQMMGMGENSQHNMRKLYAQRIDKAYASHQALRTWFPKTTGYKNKWVLGRNTNLLVGGISKASIQFHYSISLGDFISYIEGTSQELSELPTKNKQILKEAGLLALSATGLALKPDTSALLGVSAVLGIDLGSRIISKYVYGEPVGPVGLYRQAIKGVKNLGRKANT